MTAIASPSPWDDWKNNSVILQPEKEEMEKIVTVLGARKKGKRSKPCATRKDGSGRPALTLSIRTGVRGTVCGNQDGKGKKVHESEKEPLKALTRKFQFRGEAIPGLIPNNEVFASQQIARLLEGKPSTGENWNPWEKKKREFEQLCRA